ncbi:MAG TPA: outer membrane protein assembly factor BamA [Burkholderiales bacterium]|jgi:outer membrane protein insertion porin family|nr:outer membrane protein assembly factor BamA [Burkholderiales bacterium]
MIRRGLAAVLAALAFAGAAGAQSFEPFTVKDIRVEGLQRTEPGTVFSYLPIKVGETVNQERAREAVRALYATGFFSDVRLEHENDVLVVFVQERPAIAQIDFSGMKEFEPDAVRKVLRENGLAEGRIFDRSVLENAEQELKRQYLSRGLYGAEIQTTVTPLERNRVGINIAVTEGEVAKIRGINIVGAQAFSESELVSLFVLRTPGWLTWYTKHDRYAREKLSADLETLRSYYQNRGYLDFAIESTQVSITPDRHDIYITVNITEGERYTVSDVQLSGQTPVPRAELEKLVQLKPGDVFSREKLAASTKAIGERLGNDGYAFANANAIPNVDKEKRTVAFNIVVDPGRRVYVRRIDVAGNSKTRDEVVRREMRQLEGAFYDASKIQLSRRRIERTGYFSETTVETQPVEGSADQVDVLYTVKERPTGALLFGVGFSSVEKFAISTSIRQSNAFGTGKFISANVNSGKVNTVYALSYNDPYYTVDGVSQGFDVYKRKTDASSLATGAYITNAVGGGIKFGYPVSEISSVDVGVNLESVTLTTFDTSPRAYLDFVNQFGNDYVYGAFTAGWQRDTRDSVITPNAGGFTRLSGEVAGGDLEYYRLNFQQSYYWRLSRIYTLLARGELGYAHGLGQKPVPFFKGYYAGGPDSVRGFRPFSLGPRDVDGNSTGGTFKVIGATELLFPMPGATAEQSLRLGAFIDFGQVYAADTQVRLGELRYAGGFALQWLSPFGPLRLSIANPINRKDGDQVQRLQFTFGTGF